MPLYLHCPHCEHPQVIPVHRRGRLVICRQCGRTFRGASMSLEVDPLPFAHYGELPQPKASSRQRVYVLDA